MAAHVVGTDRHACQSNHRQRSGDCPGACIARPVGSGVVIRARTAAWNIVGQVQCAASAGGISIAAEALATAAVFAIAAFNWLFILLRVAAHALLDIVLRTLPHFGEQCLPGPCQHHGNRRNRTPTSSRVSPAPDALYLPIPWDGHSTLLTSAESRWPWGWQLTSSHTANRWMAAFSWPA